MTRPAPSQVTVLLPGLFDGAADADRLPTRLASLLARADRLAASPPGFDARLFDLFGVTPPADQDLPIAAVTRLADMGVVDREWWIRADPVYLEPGRDTLVLHPVHLTAADASQLVLELNESLAPDGWLLRAPHPQRWYAKPPVAPSLVTTPLADAIGRDIRTLLPRGPDGRTWHTRLSELQILLHTAGANAAREARRERPANSVWFWGGGRLPQAGIAPWTRVWSEEPLAQGLARLCGLPSGALPADGAAWLADSPPDQNLIVIDALHTTPFESDPAARARLLEQVVERWIAPLQRAVARGRLAGITVLGDRGPSFHYRRAHRLRFWRRAHPLAVYRAA